mgnify:CR=1 FL=1
MSNTGRNVGQFDRFLRISAGLAIALIIIWQVFGNFINIILFALASLFIYTGLAASCPIYKILGKSTLKKESKSNGKKKKN